METGGGKGDARPQIRGPIPTCPPSGLCDSLQGITLVAFQNHRE